ncbi:MAG: xanthine dehydrogenase family protein molybdopterin-binding subunit [Pseudomonadota bacterium]
MSHGIGQAVRRKEDIRFITGQGQYTADVNVPEQLHLAVLRAPVAHAVINGIDTTEAAAAEGVVSVITAHDLSAAGIRDLPCKVNVLNEDGKPMAKFEHPILAKDKMVYFGEPVAAVIATTKLLAKDALELIELDYEELPVAGSASAALEPDAPQLWPEFSGNLACDWRFGDKEKTDKLFAEADHVVSIDTIQNRLVPSSMEPRATHASYDAGKDEYTLYMANQNPHLSRSLSCRDTMNIPEHKLRLIAPDVGGGFGSKTPQYSEEYLCLFGAKLTGKPVKWVSERSESFVSDAHGRDHVTHAEMALNSDGKILAVRSEHVADLGAYAMLFGPLIPTTLYATMLSGVYTVESVYARVKLAVSNTVPTDAYRGAGRPEAAYTVERLVELAAAKIGLSSTEIRRRNFIPKDEFPYEVCTGLFYDSGDYEQCMSLALNAINYEEFDRRRAESEARGKLRGMGLAVYTEVAGVGPSGPLMAGGSEIGFYEVTSVRVNPDGTVTVLTGSHSHGQGHETSFAQIVADELAMDIDDIEIVHGDTAKIPYGVGTFASRSISLGGGALSLGLKKVIAKGQIIAAHVLDADIDNLEFIDGFYKVKNSDQILAFKEVAHLAYVPSNFPHGEIELGLEETTYYDPPNFTFPAGCHCCEIEIDPETGEVSIEDYTVGDDFGQIINPMIVEGQVHGGLAQGIGQALTEHAIYDVESGQPLTGSFLDYCMPRADNLPNFTVESIDSWTDSNPLGAKGCGEAGAIGAPAAVMNAIFDALKALGVTEAHLTMPATSAKIWRAIQEAK